MMENVVYFQLTDEPDLSAAAHRLLEEAVGFSAPLEMERHGKPFFPTHPEVQFSLSHTQGAVVCAISGEPVGADVEREKRVFRAALAKRCFTERELEWIGGEDDGSSGCMAVWTRKEALLKRDGRGFSVALREVETMGSREIFTYRRDGFLISVCGSGAFRLEKLAARPI